MLRDQPGVEINAQLGIGSAQETVVVTGAPPVIQTEDSSVGLVVDSQTIQNTPLNGRLSLMGLIALAPGVQGAGAQDQLAVRGVTPSIGTGTRNSYGGLGPRSTESRTRRSRFNAAKLKFPRSMRSPSSKSLRTGAPAEFNQPAQIVVVSKSGTNQLHGGAFEYNRSKGTSAKAFFGGALPRPALSSETNMAAISPVQSYIPKLYDGRDKSFFFSAFEGFHLSQAYQRQQPAADRRRAGRRLLRVPRQRRLRPGSAVAPASTIR